MIKMIWEPECVGCGLIIDGLSNADAVKTGGIEKEATHTPKEGDLTVCISCATVMVFDKELNLVAAREHELDALTKLNRSEVEDTIKAVTKLIAYKCN